jgi:transposase
MKPYLKITLGEDELALLTQSYTNGKKHYVRQRSHALLLLNSGMVVPEIAVLFGRKEETIRRWYWGWEKDGLSGLDVKEGSGRKAKLSVSDSAVVEVVKKK